MVEGRFNYRADDSRHEGDFARIIGGVNNAVGALVGHLDDMPVASMVIDTEFNIRYLNNSGCNKMLRQNKGDLIGSKCYDFMKTGDCGTERCTAKRPMRTLPMRRVTSSASTARCRARWTRCRR
jgi:hypothetical protein